MGSEWSSCAPSRQELRLDNVRFRTLDKGDYLFPFSLRNAKSIRRGIEVAHECRPIAFVDFHPLMRGLHITSGVVQRATGTRAQKIDQQLFLPFDAILASVLPEAPQERIRLQAR